MALNPVSSPSSSAESAEAQHVQTPVLANVGGKTYVADVNYSAGEYVAQDPAIFGAEGSGPSAQAAEEAFFNRIDFLV
jgi:hypothetical protein